MKQITILIPTYARPIALALTLNSLCYQWLGIAEQRDFLLSKSKSPYTLFLDDDLVLEPFVIKNMAKILREERIGFVGQAGMGLSYLNDSRPAQERIEFWEDHVKPERIRPNTQEWLRYEVHNAANILHIQNRLNVTPDHQVKYKIAWVAGCILYDTVKLSEVGGFSFWKDLPTNHCGEEVLVQIKLMEKYGGCGLLPSGVYHQELQTTIPDRSNNAPEVLLR